MTDYICKSPVAIIFFNRPNLLEILIDNLRKVKPKELFLIQDGPRNKEDENKVNLCREVIKKIDWDCNIKTNYSEQNLGCGYRPYSGIKWVFEQVDKAIIIEDDFIPSVSFFKFCDKMLEVYENDLRVGMISGINHFGEYDFGGYSYGFTKSVGIGAWASWASRVNAYTPECYRMKEFDEEYYKVCVKNDIIPKFASEKRLNQWVKAHATLSSVEKVTFWDYQWSYLRHLNSWLTVTPAINLVRNLGICSDATHANVEVNLVPKDIRQFFENEAQDFKNEIKLQKFVIADRIYDKKLYKINYPNIIKRGFRFIRKILISLFQKGK